MVVAIEIMINMAAPANEEVPVEMTNSSHHIIHTTNQRIEGNHLIGEVQIEVEGEEVETIPLMDEEDSKVSTVIDHGLLQILAKETLMEMVQSLTLDQVDKIQDLNHPTEEVGVDVEGGVEEDIEEEGEAVDVAGDEDTI